MRGKSVICTKSLCTLRTQIKTYGSLVRAKLEGQELDLYLKE